MSSNLAISSASKMTTSMASSAPEFSISGASSIDDAEEIALYEQYLSISHARQSNPSPEMRKKQFDDWTQMQSRGLPRSRSEVHTCPIESSQEDRQHHGLHEEQQTTTLTSQIRAVSKFFLRTDILSNHRC